MAPAAEPPLLSDTGMDANMSGRLLAVVGLCCVVDFATGLTGATGVTGLTGLLSGTALAQSEFESGPSLQMLVMTDGRILQGNITRHAAGYYVERPGGSILIPSEQVRCVARDLKDAYRLQREQMIEPTSAMLIQLAEWCVSYRLYNEAGDELRRTLRRDPENDVARKMLARVEDMLRVNPAKAAPPSRSATPGFLAAEVESLGGLSRQTAADFSSKIQPLLINKCGNAGCHGTTADNEFRLNMVRTGSSNHRRAAEQNLAMVLRYVDTNEPAQSPLLTVARGQHGNASFAIFGGASGAIQEQLLKKWVNAVGLERRTEETRFAVRTPLTTPGQPAEDAPGKPVIQLANAEIVVNTPTPESMPSPTTADSVLPISSTGQPLAGSSPVLSASQNRSEIPGHSAPTAAQVGQVLPGTGSAPRRLPEMGRIPNEDGTSSSEELSVGDEGAPRRLQPTARLDRFDPEEFNRKYGGGAKPRREN